MGVAVSAVPPVITSYRITVMLDVFHLAHLRGSAFILNVTLYAHYQLCVYLRFMLRFSWVTSIYPLSPLSVCVCACVNIAKQVCDYENTEKSLI
jgi:hypothetical protein